ncbi:nucleotide sugar dehydrogenase [Ralstonia sp. 24A2]|uniref:nucleotide sugar dehydrogenase n=1 Tax=Ralstonia sp. 24A2 TaxID=3447364 RepID=UPI003F6A2D0C
MLSAHNFEAAHSYVASLAIDRQAQFTPSEHTLAAEDLARVCSRRMRPARRRGRHLHVCRITFIKEIATSSREKSFVVESHLIAHAPHIHGSTPAGDTREMQCIAVVGLGYVGAPLAHAFSKHFRVWGVDINAARVAELSEGHDRTHELSSEELRNASIRLTTDASVLVQADIIIVAVPTPVDGARIPDLEPVKQASIAVGQHMKRGAIVVYESTAYPGVTEEVCIPVLEHHSGLKHLQDFHVGYSPERINPGDRVHTLATTTKIVSGDTPQTLDTLIRLYGSITHVYPAASIKVAEAAKVLEDTQRDVNIALMNEVSQQFSTLGVDTHDVLDAARSKWNFLDFQPGLVGGHCISVDPYYLMHNAATSGFNASLILSARETNDGMARFVVDQLLHWMTKCHLLHPQTIVTVLGVTFKEDVPDARNSKVIDIVKALDRLGIRTQVVDPLADGDDVAHTYGVQLIPLAEVRPADAIVLAVPHAEYREGGWPLIESLVKPHAQFVVCDLKAVLDRDLRPEHAMLWRP